MLVYPSKVQMKVNHQMQGVSLLRTLYLCAQSAILLGKTETLRPSVSGQAFQTGLIVENKNSIIIHSTAA